MIADDGMMTGIGGLKKIARSDGDRDRLRNVLRAMKNGSNRKKKMSDDVQKIGRSVRRRRRRKRRSDAGMKRSYSAAGMKSDAARRLSATRQMRHDGASVRASAKKLTSVDKGRRPTRKKRLSRNERTTPRGMRR